MAIFEYSDKTDVTIIRDQATGVYAVVAELEDDLYLTAVYRRGRVRETLTYDPRSGGRIGRTKIHAAARELVKEHAENIAARDNEQER